GSVVGVHYDPMLAKVISFAPTRGQAAQLLAGALARTELHGLRTNRDLLVNILRHPAFLAGDTDTAFFDTHGLDTLARPLADPDVEALSALAAALATGCGASTGDMAETGALVVLATTPGQAARLAQAGTGSRLSITIHGHTH
ncbi:hypothetical protein ACFQQL_19130, partial [Georgenia alba]